MWPPASRRQPAASTGFERQPTQAGPELGRSAVDTRWVYGSEFRGLLQQVNLVAITPRLCTVPVHVRLGVLACR